MSGLDWSINEIVDTIWNSTPAVPVIADDPFQSGDNLGRAFTGVVQISGTWAGAVAVHCTEALARRATTAMMGIPDDDVVRNHIQDARGELANMTGGNIKALLPEPCTLGLPVVIEGTDFRKRLPGVQELQGAFRSYDQPFSVTVHRRVSA